MRHVDIYIILYGKRSDMSFQESQIVLFLVVEPTRLKHWTLANLSCLLSNALSLSVTDYPLDRVHRYVIPIQIVVSNI